MGMRADAVTAEVVRRLAHDGIAAIVIKGPAVQHWIHGGAPRLYVDTDLLVEPGDFTACERVLAELGFTKMLDIDEAINKPLVHAHTWRRPDATMVDLHRTIPGVGVSPGELWAVLGSQVATIPVGGVDVAVPGCSATAFLLALHAAVHGAKSQPTRDELSLAVERLDGSSWTAAAALAERLDAVPAFVSGLELARGGRELLDQLRVRRERRVEVTLRAEAAPPGALALEQLAGTEGLGARLELLSRRIGPTPAYMRLWSPLARRGVAGLAVAYGWRGLLLAVRLGPAILAWRRARRQAA